MAALLRSARLLKLSPAGLLHVAGTKRTGPPLGRRLFSGALGGSRTAGCARLARQTPGNASCNSGVWPCAVGCMRGYSVATEKKEEASNLLLSKQAQQFDWAMAKLDSSVRRTGRVTKTLLLGLFHDICRTGYPSGNQALLLVRSCGSLLPEVPLEERTELAHRVWEKLQELGAQFDVSHYNALLKVYLQNEFKFSPTDFLAKMEAANVQPNRVTYQRLIAAYCQNGDIEGASTILGFMKSKDLPITEAVFNSLVTGHARAGDIENAKNILSVMQGAGIEPGPDSYVALLTVYAEKGDMESLKMTMEEAERADCNLMDRDILQIIFALAKAGHKEHIPEMMALMKQERGYVPDAMNLCLSLITLGHEDTAFLILKNFYTDSHELGNFFLKHCVNMDMTVEKICRYSEELQQSNRHKSPLVFALFCALEANKTGMSLEMMKIIKKQDLPIRQHFFYPLFTKNLKIQNTAGVLEVAKAMGDLGLSPDLETLRKYIFPAFPSLEAAQQALVDEGISLKPEDVLHLDVRNLAARNLEKLYTQLSDPSFPSMDLSVFRNNLINGFKTSNDVESMTKLTELLYNDKRFSSGDSKPAEATSYFLYNLFDHMTQEEVQERKETLQKYLNELQTQNVIISRNIFKGIKNILQSYNVPELLNDVFALVDPKDRVSTGDAAAFPGAGTAQNLENRLAELKAENKPLNSLFRQTLMALCAEEKLQRALELKQQHEEEMTASVYAILIDQCCRRDEAEEALNLKREMSRKDSSVALDAPKYIALVKVLASNDKVEEAVDVLKEMKEKEVVINSLNINRLFHVFNYFKSERGVPTIRRLQETVFSLGLAKPTNNLCSPLVTAYLESDDLSGALEAVLECQKRYKTLPRIHEVLVALVEKGDTDQLQKAMDFVSQERGEMNMLYDLYFAFLQSGRYREARKIIETPGLRARPGRLQWFAEKCISSNKMEDLEQMVEMTAKLYECDRDEMYNYILCLCKKNKSWEKAAATWTKMQEENIIPRERTLRLLADILKSNGQEVPFELPETWYEKAASTQQEASAVTPKVAEADGYGGTRLMALCKKGKAREAFTMLKEADEKDMTLKVNTYDFLIRALLSEGAMEDALVVKDIAESRLPDFKPSNIADNLFIVTYSKKGMIKEAVESLRSMLQMSHVPSQLAISRLVQALGRDGNVAGIEEVESQMKDLGTSLNVNNMMFVNNKALAHIKNGDVDSAVELLEAVYTTPHTNSPSMASVFKKIMENNEDEAFDKLSAMAERLANHFACYRPSMDIFFLLLDMGKIEDAKFMLARCNALAEQKGLLVHYLSQKARYPGQLDKIKALQSLIPDFVEKDVLYSYLMKCHSLDKDLPSAKALHTQIEEEGMVADELSLKRLAELYRNAGESVPFVEPTGTFKDYADMLKKKTGQNPAEE